MSTNPYFDPTEETLSRNTLARAEQIVRLFTGVKEGFGKLPAPENLNSGSVNFAEDTGIATNAYVVEAPNGPTTPTRGTSIAFYAKSANTGPATLTYGSWDPKALRRSDGSELTPGDIRAGQQVEARYHGPYWTVSAIIVAEVQAAIDAAQTVNALQTEIETIGSVSTELLAVHANLAELTDLQANLSDLTTVAQNLADVRNASAIVNGLTPANVGAVSIYQNLSTATALQSGGQYRFTTVGLTHTLPTDPAIGDTIFFEDGEVINATGADGETVSLDGGPNPIMGSTGPFVVNVRGIRFALWWNGADWRLF
jgi:hypothetical protein